MTYTFDVLSTLDGYAYLGEQGPELLAHRLALYGGEHRMVFGAAAYGALLAEAEETPWIARMLDLPATVVSNTPHEPLGRPNATLVRDDPVDVVARLRKESAVPLRSYGSPMLNRALMAAGLVDRVQVTLFPSIGGAGEEPILHGWPAAELELIGSRTFDGHTQELLYSRREGR